MLFDYKIYLILPLMMTFSSDLQADKIHDPTAPKFAGRVDESGAFNRTAVAKDSALSLQGIVNKKDTRMAIIGGQLFRKGDSINGYVISEVNRTNVVLSKSGSEKRLYVYEK